MSPPERNKALLCSRLNDFPPLGSLGDAWVMHPQIPVSSLYPATPPGIPLSSPGRSAAVNQHLHNLTDSRGPSPATTSVTSPQQLLQDGGGQEVV